MKQYENLLGCSDFLRSYKDFYIDNIPDLMLSLNIMFKSNKLHTVKRTYRVDTSQISFLKFILEAYDGMAQLTTSNPGLGLVEVYVASGCIKDFEKIIMDLKKQMLIELIGYAEENSAYP